MLTQFDDFDRTFAFMDQLRRRMDRLFDEAGPARGPSRDALRRNLVDEAERGVDRGNFPRMTFSETGQSIVVRADLPGITEADVQLTIHQDVLTITATRNTNAPEGWFVHRRERTPFKIERTYSLPCNVDPEKSSASVKDGVLTITLVKAAEAHPHSITVTAQ